MQTYYIYRPFQKFDVALSMDSEGLADNIACRFGDYFGLDKKKECLPFRILQLDEKTFAVHDGKNETQTENPLLAVDDFLFHQTVFEDSVLALHGAAVEHKGKAYLFLAATTSGKTTLTAYLTQLGFGYLTDDCILLEKSPLRVHPYPTPLHLRKGGVEVLKHLQVALPGLDDRGDRLLFQPANKIGRALPLAAIYFIERTDRENSLVPMETQEKIIHLLKSPITPYPFTAEYLRSMSALAVHVKGILRYHTMDFVARQIKAEGGG